jgi:hypothetical protein
MQAGINAAIPLSTLTTNITQPTFCQSRETSEAAICPQAFLSVIQKKNPTIPKINNRRANDKVGRNPAGPFAFDTSLTLPPNSFCSSIIYR